MFPFEEEIIRVTVTGRQLKSMIHRVFCPESLASDHAEYYQFSRDFRVVVSLREQRVTELTFAGAPIEDDRLFRVGLQTYHFMNMAELLGISQEEAAENAPIRTLATSARDALDEYLSRMELVTCPEDLRWVTLE